MQDSAYTSMAAIDGKSVQTKINFSLILCFSFNFVGFGAFGALPHFHPEPN